MRGAAGDRYCGSDNGNGDGNGDSNGTGKELADLPNVWRKETREDQDNANKRGGQSRVRRLGNLDRGVMRGR